MEQQLSELEADLLLLFYTFSDQRGVVDMPLVRDIAKNQLGVMLGQKQIVLAQRHVDKLAEMGILPDVSAVIVKAKAPKKAARAKKPPAQN